MGHGLRSTLCVVVLQGVSEQRIHLTDRNLQQVVRWDGPDIRFFYVQLDIKFSILLTSQATRSNSTYCRISPLTGYPV